MPKIRLTKGELKRQRDSLRQYERYLPTLQLKKQQLQMEILRQRNLLKERHEKEKLALSHIESWAGLLSDEGVEISKWLKPQKETVDSRNIAGVDIPLFRNLEFPDAQYDLFFAPLWVDAAVVSLRELASLRRETEIIYKGVDILNSELRQTTQRVNLFEKVKIPQAKESIRLIKIYIGDQMTNAVGRSKMAKRKIEETITEEAVV